MPDVICILLGSASIKEVVKHSSSIFDLFETAACLELDKIALPVRSMATTRAAAQTASKIRIGIVGIAVCLKHPQLICWDVRSPSASCSKALLARALPNQLSKEGRTVEAFAADSNVRG